MTKNNTIDNDFDLFQVDEYRHASDDIQRQADIMKDNGKTITEITNFCIKEQKRKIAERLKVKLNLTQRYASCTFDNFKVDSEIQKKSLQQAKNYVELVKNGECKGKNLIIVGNKKVGTGKTHLGCAIVNALCNIGIPALFINSVKMFNDVRGKWNSTEYKKIDVLFIDDIGKEKVTEWGCQTLYDIINERYEHLKPTILTIENDIPSLQEYYNESYDGVMINRGNAITSRITSDFELITLDCDDYRHKR